MTEEEQKQKRDYYRTIYDVKSWLNLHISQLNYTRNLVLTFAIATLGYELNVYSKLSNTFKSRWDDWRIIAIILMLSILFGLLMAALQSENFRIKRRISRIIEKDVNFVSTEKNFKELENICGIIETTIYILSMLQIFAFLLGLTRFVFLISRWNVI